MGDATQDENSAALVSDSQNTCDHGDSVGDDHGHGNAGEVGENASSASSDDGSSNSASASGSDSNVSDNERMGTLQSARFNILSTMVGGGSLSLPLAFHQAGNALLAPLLLGVIALLVTLSIHLLIDAALLSEQKMKKSRNGNENEIENDRNNSSNSGDDDDNNNNNNNNHNSTKGTLSFEETACAAFGPRAKYASMSLIATICYFTVVGYGVLLRDMLLPISDMIFSDSDSDSDSDSGSSSSSSSSGPTFHHNATMLAVIFLITPLCTLRDLSPLEKVGALSMSSLGVVGLIISYRSWQCNFSSASEWEEKRLMDWYDYMSLGPSSSSASSWYHDLLNAMPILISIFMCHFNVLPVHNELKNPTSPRVQKLFTTSIGAACSFYLYVGFTGSMYGNCTEDGMVEGNVLLSFEEDDPLLLVGRACLSLTITAAFPVLVVPCRDIVLRALGDSSGDVDANANVGVEGEGNEILRGPDDDNDNNLAEPLLGPPNTTQEAGSQCEDKIHEEHKEQRRRIVASVVILWSGAAIACCVESIDIVWDILGGSFSLFMGFLIPSGAYIVLSAGSSGLEPGQSLNDENVDLEGVESSPVPPSEEDHGEWWNAEDDDSEEDPSSSARESLMIRGEGTEVAGSESRQESTREIKQQQGYVLLSIFVPMVFLLTGNAIYNIVQG